MSCRANGCVLVVLAIVASCDTTQLRAGLGEPCDGERTCRPNSVCANGTCQLRVEADAAAAAPAEPDALRPPSVDAAADSANDVGSAPLSAPGCGDGTREGFLDGDAYPRLAACSGGWTVPGVTSTASRTPVCNRMVGNENHVLTGAGCAVEDLCARGWHVCEGLADVRRAVGAVADAGAAPDWSCADAIPPGGPEAFYVTRQRGHDLGSGMGTECDDQTASSNNVFGCGDLGVPVNRASCMPFRMLAYRADGVSDCNETWPWDCGADGKIEADQVLKLGPSGGGALCCQD